MYKRINLEHSLTPYPKIKFKWITDLNVKPDTTKLLKENIWRTLFVLRKTDDLLVIQFYMIQALRDKISLSRKFFKKL